MFHPGAKHQKAALALDDLASALDAGLPLESIGGNPSLGDHMLLDLAGQRGVELKPSEKAILEAGWQSGKASDALRSRAAQRRQQADFLEQAWAGLSYPICVLCALPIAAVLTFSIIGPTLAVGLGIAYAILAALALFLARKIGRGDPDLDRYPVIGSLLEDLRELPYLESLHALYGAGIPIVEAHLTAIRTVQMRGLRERLGLAQQHLTEGKPLREALELSGALSTETRTLLATGEQAGQLEEALERALTRRRQVASRKLQTAARRIGNLAYAFAVVGVVVLISQFYSNYFGMLKLR